MATAIMSIPFDLETEYSSRSSGVPVQILMQALQYLPYDCVLVGIDTNMDTSTFDVRLYSNEFYPETKLVAKFKTQYTENLPGLFGTIQVFDGVEEILSQTASK